MSAIHQVLLAGSSTYQIPYSLRFRAANSGNLSRTFGTPTSNKKWTWSGWVKFGDLATSDENLFGSEGTSPTLVLGFNSSDRTFVARIAGTLVFQTSAVYRDPSSWGHVVVVFDSDNATTADRFILYYNGTRQATSTNSVSSGATTSFNAASKIGFVGRNYGWNATSADYFDGYMAEVNFVDGQALTPSSFGQTDSATGVWVAKKYAGSYGTNGFYLKFNDATSTTTIGYDEAGSNDFTTSGISVTSGVTFDQMTDTPTLGYAVMNPLDLSGTAGTYSAANLNYTKAAGGNAQAYSSITMASGKWYCEVTMGADIAEFVPGIIAGSANAGANRYLGQDSFTYAYYYDGRKINSASFSAYGNSYVSGDVIGIILDADNGKLYFSKNGTVQASGDPVAGTNAAFTGLTGPYRFAVSAESSGIGDVNFGQRAFAYTPPSGFKALNTTNLPTPSVKKGSLYFDCTLRTGTGATASVSSLGFQPDLVWIKSRSAATNHNLFDSSRGTTVGLITTGVNAEYTDANSLTAFNANGYSLGNDASSRGVNINTNTYVDWAWKKGATPGFDIVTYTGNAANRTVAHSLGAAPAFIAVKSRSGSPLDEWFNYHQSRGATRYIRWGQTGIEQTSSLYWNDTAPTSSVFSLGTNTAINANSVPFIAYLWSEIEGFSKFGSYTGNGSADGPFVFCGFRPAFVLTKRTDAIGNWYLWDNKRIIAANGDAGLLYTDSASAESDYNAAGIDLLSNGFKLRNADGSNNASGGTYIFAAFAENPFKYARAR